MAPTDVLLYNLSANSIGFLGGALVLMPMDRHIGKIPQAGFWNSYLVCLVGASLSLLAWYLLFEAVGRVSPDAVEGLVRWLLMSDVNSGLLHWVILIPWLILAAIYVAAARFIWRTTWRAAMKANIIWIGIMGVFCGCAVHKLS